MASSSVVKVPLAWQKLSTIDNGVVVGPSQWGKGLFAQRSFAKNQFITEYVGKIISHDKATELRATREDTHVRKLLTQFAHIDGLKVPVATVGGGSFSNHDRKGNAKLICKDGNMIPTSIKSSSLIAPRVEGKHDIVCDTHAFLLATKPIAAGDEILTNYGQQYWWTHAIDAPSSSSPSSHAAAVVSSSSSSSVSSSSTIVTTTRTSSMCIIQTRARASSATIANTNTNTNTGAPSSVTSSYASTPAPTTVAAVTTGTTTVVAVDDDRVIPVVAAITTTLYRTQCITCGKQYRFPYQLRRHTNTHVKRCNYLCIACGSTYTDASNAKRCVARGCPVRTIKARAHTRRRN